MLSQGTLDFHIHLLKLFPCPSAMPLLADLPCKRRGFPSSSATLQAATEMYTCMPCCFSSAQQILIFPTVIFITQLTQPVLFTLQNDLFFF